MYLIIRHCFRNILRGLVMRVPFYIFNNTKISWCAEMNDLSSYKMGWISTLQFSTPIHNEYYFSNDKHALPDSFVASSRLLAYVYCRVCGSPSSHPNERVLHVDWCVCCMSHHKPNKFSIISVLHSTYSENLRNIYWESSQ